MAPKANVKFLPLGTLVYYDRSNRGTVIQVNEARQTVDVKCILGKSAFTKVFEAEDLFKLNYSLEQRCISNSRGNIF